MKNSYLAALAVALAVLLLALAQMIPCDSCEKDVVVDDSVFQVSTFNALLMGLYDGNVTVAELAEHGDLGIGTFNSLDGEMVVLDGVVYQVRDTGVVSRADPLTKTPFASVTFFRPDSVLQLEGTVNYSVLQSGIDESLPTENIPYAIRVTGTYGYVKVRAPHRQDKPYPALVDALANQSVYEYSDIEGTLVGFRLPDYVNGINVPGYHMHFIDSSGSYGGHVLDFSIERPLVGVDYKYEFGMVLPDAAEFNEVELSGDKTEEIEKVEK